MPCFLPTVFLYVRKVDYQPKAEEFFLQRTIDLEVDELSQQRSGGVDDNLPSVKIRSFMPK
jgi:hypothetical protein